ncbi:hypothetical protein COL922a_012228, partial [Colletotrichum nupharicola]
LLALRWAMAYVTLGNGKRLEADLVLAGDGIRSVIRDQILRETGQPIDPIITDVTLYGVSLTKEEMENHPGLAPLMDQSYLNIYMSRKVFEGKWITFVRPIGTGHLDMWLRIFRDMIDIWLHKVGS